ncbi:acyl carrier protein [Kitasatospora sp. NPDC004669]|uniref:acyl carrier protein n=1 Tax=Kitasatospora sp. NPDC004669 TaxID=3154555 RepID=UPI0033A46A9B
MDDKTIEEQVKEIVAKELGRDLGEIQNEYSFIGDLGASNANITAMFDAMEEKFPNVEFTIEEYDSLTTVQAVIDFIAKHS